LGNLIYRVHDTIDVFVRHRRPELGGIGQATDLRPRLTPAYLASETPPAERRPYDRAEALVQAERHQLPLVIAPDQRIVRLIGDVARKAVFVGNGERLHQVPA